MGGGIRRIGTIQSIPFTVRLISDVGYVMPDCIEMRAFRHDDFNSDTIQLTTNTFDKLRKILLYFYLSALALRVRISTQELNVRRRQ